MHGEVLLNPKSIVEKVPRLLFIYIFSYSLCLLGAVQDTEQKSVTHLAMCEYCLRLYLWFRGNQVRISSVLITNGCLWVGANNGAIICLPISSTRPKLPGEDTPKVVVSSNDDVSHCKDDVSHCNDDDDDDVSHCNDDEVTASKCRE